MSLFGAEAFAQGIGISEASITPNANSILELRSTLRGFLAPRMTTAQRTTLGGLTPAAGMLVYDTDTKSFWYYDNAGWNKMALTTDITSGTATNFSGALSGDVTGTQSATTVGKINGTSMAGLATGILKNTTSTGVPSIAVAGDFPTLNQNTTGTASNVTGIVAPANGGTGVANNSAATVTSSGNYAYTRTLTGTTNVTFPTSGTLYGSASGSISSANLSGSLSDETGTGLAVFGTAPTLASTVTIGTAGGTTGAINMKGTTSGTTTITVPATGGSPTITFGTTTGTVAVLTDISGGTSTNFSGSLAGDVTGAQGATVVGKINGVSLGGLATGILKNTTSTGVPSIAVAGDFPTLNQNTTGTAAGFTGSLSGDVSGTQAATTVGKINGTSMAALATGILKNTTTTGVPSIAVAGDFPTLNQNTTGTAAGFTGSLSGDVSGTQAATTVGKINGTSMAALATGILKNTTGTGIPSIATAGTDYAAGVANPSATIGLTAVNGTATSAIRSDGAPALSQSIIPTWSGLHTFTGGITLSGTTAISISADASNTTVNLGSGAGAKLVSLGSSNGASSLTERVGTGNYNLDGVAGSTYTIGASTTTGTIIIGGTAQSGAITLGSSSAAQTLNLGTGAGASTVNIANGVAGSVVSIANGINTSAQTINIGAGANAANNTINIGSALNTAGVTAITIGSNQNLANTTLIEGGNGTGAITLDPHTAGSIIIGDVAGTGAITLGSSTGAQAINIGIGGTGAKTITIGDGASTGSTTIKSGTGMIVLYGKLKTQQNGSAVTASESGAGVPTLTTNSNDIAGIVTSSTTAHTYVRVTFPATYTNAPFVVVSPANAAAGTICGSTNSYNVTTTATYLQINMSNSSSSSAWAYHVFGN